MYRTANLLRVFVSVVIFVLAILHHANAKLIEAENNGQVPERPPRTPKLIAYYQGFTSYREPELYMPWDLDAEKLTHVIYTFMDINGLTKKAESGDPWTDYLRPLDFQKPWNCQKCAFGNFAALFKHKQRHPHLQTLISLGGWTYSHFFSDAVATPETRKVFAESVLKLILDYGFDGVDIDWEFPILGGPPGIQHRPEDAENLAAFTKELRKQFTDLGYNKHFWISVTIYHQTEFNVPNYNWEEFEKHVDWINVMSYEMMWKTTRTRHHAPLFKPKNNGESIDSVMTDYKKTKLPNNFFVIGIAMYGRKFEGLFSLKANSDGFNERFQRGYPIVGYNEILKQIDDGKVERFWDDQAKVPWAFNREDKSMISYDDQESVKEKTKYALNNEYGGIFFWDIAFDKNTNGKDLVSAAHSVLKDNTDFRNSLSKNSMCVSSSKYIDNIDCKKPAPELVDPKYEDSLIQTCSADNQVTIVFNDGPSEYITPELMKTLEELEIKATFMVSPTYFTENVRRSSLAFDLKAAGHYVTHNGYTLDSYFDMNKTEISDDLYRADDIVGQVLEERPVNVGTPKRHLDERILNYAGELGYQILFPNFDSRDYEGPQGFNAMKVHLTNIIQKRIKDDMENVNANGENDGEEEEKPKKPSYMFVLSHLNKYSIDALPDVTKMFTGQGYEIVSLEKCLGERFAGYRKVLDTPTRFDDQVPNFSDPSTKSCGAPGQVAFGFHGSPTNDFKELIDYLIREDIKSTFFVVGNQLVGSYRNKNLILRARREGHTIGSHSYAYSANFSSLSERDILNDLKMNDNVLSKIMGVSPTMVLAPYNRFNERIDKILSRQGYLLIKSDFILQSSSLRNMNNAILDLRNTLINYFESPENSSFIILLNELTYKPKEVKIMMESVKQLGYKVVGLDECIKNKNMPLYRSFSSTCGDYLCDYEAGEQCSNCPKDCKCPDPSNILTSQSTETDRPKQYGGIEEAIDWTDASLVWKLGLGVIGVVAAIVLMGIKYRQSRETQSLKIRFRSSSGAQLEDIESEGASSSIPSKVRRRSRH